MKDRLISGGLIFGLFVLAVIGFSLSVKQCSEKKIAKQKLGVVNNKYLALLESKSRVDTVYKEGKTVYIHKTDFKTITDTLFVEGNKVFKEYSDSLKTPELNLSARIVANELRSINYEYSVREKIIIRENIVYKTDTLKLVNNKAHLYGIADIGLDTYGIGLQYQTKKRIGFVAKYNWYNNDTKFITIGASYRIY